MPIPLRMVTEPIHREREGLLARLAEAYQRRDLDVFREVCRPDMVLTLAGSSGLAGTYHGYGAFAEYLQSLRHVLRSAERRISFEHRGNEMIFWQVMEVLGVEDDVQMTFRVTVRFHYADGRIESFFVEPEDLERFDTLVDSLVPVTERP